MNIKVGDGDLVMLTIGGDKEFADKTADKIMQWIKKRGLQDIELIATLKPTQTEFIDLKILSVNDVFENAVLNKK